MFPSALGHLPPFEKLCVRTSVPKLTDRLVDMQTEWGQHVAEISSEATKALCFLRRGLALAPRHTKEVAYQTLVLPQLECAAPIWHPCNETETKRWRKCRRQQPGGSAGDGIMPVASMTCLMNLSGHPWRTAC